MQSLWSGTRPRIHRTDGGPAVPAMSPLKALRRVAAAIRSSVESLVDAIPPYLIYEGPLAEKLRDGNGRSLLRCGRDLVEVDGFTYESLNVGDRLRLRYTRGRKAVSIDRLVPPSGRNKTGVQENR